MPRMVSSEGFHRSRICHRNNSGNHVLNAGHLPGAFGPEGNQMLNNNRINTNLFSVAGPVPQTRFTL
jgi:hypothetical protein